MNYILEFYKGLDTVNLIIFWGVIIVVLLLLIFAIIITNKNKKLEKIIESKGINIDNNDIDQELAIKKVDEFPIIENKIANFQAKDTLIKESKEEPVLSKKNILLEPDTKEEDNLDIPITQPEKEVKEEKFVVEEHVMEYNNNFFKMPTIKQEQTNKEILAEEKFKDEKAEIVDPPIPYQKNVLRQVYPNQTSPIGIVKNDTSIEKEISKAKELNEIFNNTNNSDNEYSQRMTHEEALIKNIDNQIEKENYKYQDSRPISYENKRKGNYLEELSKKLSQNNEQNDIKRTEYELKQEEDAIISYDELMQKRDSIQIVDEEDAIISIEELKKRKQTEEKLYNITEKENNSDFIKELKNFRSDL